MLRPIDRNDCKRCNLVMIIYHILFAVPPNYDGGAPVTEFEVQMTGPDNTPREVYRGRDLDCSVAGLLPGRPYLFQVKAVNRAGVSIIFCSIVL